MDASLLLCGDMSGVVRQKENSSCIELLTTSVDYLPDFWKETSLWSFSHVCFWHFELHQLRVIRQKYVFNFGVLCL